MNENPALIALRHADVLAGNEACIGCGCTDNWGCPEGCFWIHGPLDDPRCSRCALPN
jgi:hypothetical protein